MDIDRYDDGGTAWRAGKGVNNCLIIFHSWERRKNLDTISIIATREGTTMMVEVRGEQGKA